MQKLPLLASLTVIAAALAAPAAYAADNGFYLGAGVTKSKVDGLEDQLDFDDEVVFRANQYLYDHVRNTPEQPFCLTVSMTHPHDPYTIPAEFWNL